MISENLSNIVEYVSIKSGYRSDHSAVVFKFTFKKDRKAAYIRYKIIKEKQAEQLKKEKNTMTLYTLSCKMSR